MVQPIKNNILVEPFKGSNQTESGFIIPDSAIKESNHVKVIAVGEGTKKRPMKLKVGDTGYRVQNWGSPVIDDGKLFYIMEDVVIIALD
jgi:chaperonin GroES